MRKKILPCLALIAVLSLGSFPCISQATDYPKPMPMDYQYRTAKVAEPQPEKTFWDYLSFFAIKSQQEPENKFPAAEAEELRARTRELVQQLLVNAADGLADEYILTVNSFVNLNSLYTTSSLGRYLGEQMIGELQAAGIGVIDVRKSNSLMIREPYGEYGLSREMSELRSSHNSQGMVVGTYSYANGQILLNARVLRNSDGMVISHANTAFALDPLTGAMLKDEAMPPRRGGMVSVETVN
ncbi:MAG: FlgO family outer membrane protein [Desulfobulbaceae bacterium]|nr:FlgO family outer membrane protein [Desulfobulbaceae bacterium]